MIRFFLLSIIMVLLLPACAPEGKIPDMIAKQKAAEEANKSTTITIAVQPTPIKTEEADSEDEDEDDKQTYDELKQSLGECRQVNDWNTRDINHLGLFIEEITYQKNELHNENKMLKMQVQQLLVERGQ